MKSPAATTNMTTLKLFLILEFSARNPTIGEVLLAGILNARTGSLNYGAEEDATTEERNWRKFLPVIRKSRIGRAKIVLSIPQGR